MFHWRPFCFIGDYFHRRPFVSSKTFSFIEDPFVLSENFLIHQRPFISLETHSFHWRHFCVIENPFVSSDTLLFYWRPFFHRKLFRFIGDTFFSSETLLFHGKLFCFIRLFFHRRPLVSLETLLRREASKNYFYYFSFNLIPDRILSQRFDKRFSNIFFSSKIFFRN